MIPNPKELALAVRQAWPDRLPRFKFLIKKSAAQYGQLAWSNLKQCGACRNFIAGTEYSFAPHACARISGPVEKHFSCKLFVSG